VASGWLAGGRSLFLLPCRLIDFYGHLATDGDGKLRCRGAMLLRRSSVISRTTGVRHYRNQVLYFYLFYFFLFFVCLQCFDAVGWAAGTASGL